MGTVTVWKRLRERHRQWEFDVCSSVYYERVRVMVCIVILLIILFLIYLYLLKPNTGRGEALRPFEERYIAHRGLFKPENVPENSCAAFDRAVKRGYGIELDVQLTKDGKLVVFHDATLMRMCGIERKLQECSYQELQKFTLGKSTEKIPLFQDVLNLVAGKVPMIIEVKAEGDYIKTTKRLFEILGDYSGIYCVESFHPGVLAWCRRHKPEVLRGQLSTNYWKNKINRTWPVKFVLTNLLLNFYGKPDFIAYNYQYADTFSYALCRKLYRVKNAAWTVRSEEALAQAEKIFSIIIFDGFIPEK